MRALVPIDGSSATFAALDRALGMLRGLPGLELTLLTVRQEGFAEVADPELVAETFEADEEDEVFPSDASAGRVLARAGEVAKRHGVPATPQVAEGRYREVILREAAAHDLLVMHALGRSNLRDALKGSGTEHLARNAPCAVMLVPGEPG